VAVGRRFRHEIGAELGCGAGLVLDVDLTVEPLGQFARKKPSQQIVTRTGRERNHDPHRPRRKILGIGWLRHDAESREQRCGGQNSSHRSLPFLF
jgi:hypothetical protein